MVGQPPVPLTLWACLMTSSLVRLSFILVDANFSNATIETPIRSMAIALATCLGCHFRD